MLRTRVVACLGLFLLLWVSVALLLLSYAPLQPFVLLHPPRLLFCCATLDSLLPVRLLLFNVGYVLRSALPLRIQDQPLVVLSLRKDAGPCLEERRGILDCLGYRLWLSVCWVCDSAVALTPMLSLAFCKLSTTPSITLLTLRTLSSSRCSAASRASSVV